MKPLTSKSPVISVLPQPSNDQTGESDRKSGVRTRSLTKPRRRLSTAGEQIGFESDGAVPSLAVPTSPLLDSKTDSGIFSSISYLSCAGKVPMNPNKTNQDRCWVSEVTDKIGSHKFFGVADGHGVHGHLVSEMTKEKLGTLLEKQPMLTSDPRSSLFASHIRLNQEIFNSFVDATFSGSTSVSVLVKGNKLYCANVGDSRAIVGSLVDGVWKTTALSTDHKPDLPEEQRRILAKGGRVTAYKSSKGEPMGPARVWLKNKDLPGLAMSRSFGDKIAASVGVHAEPEITEKVIESHFRAIIVGSDGVWEFLSNDEVMGIVAPFVERNDSEGAAAAVCAEADARWKAEEDVVDDITVIVLFLK